MAPQDRFGNVAARRPARLLRLLSWQKRQIAAQDGRNGNLVRSEEGQSLVEFAMTFFILFGFVFGLMQTCLAYYTHEYISELAREGTRYAIVHGPSCETSAGASCAVAAAGINSYVSGLSWPNLAGGTMTPATTYIGVGGDLDGNFVKVTVTYVYPYKIPFFMKSNFNMSSSSVMTIIQ
jgi:Flp pilus assembly protein TadG